MTVLGTFDVRPHAAKCAANDVQNTLKGDIAKFAESNLASPSLSVFNSFPFVWNVTSCRRKRDEPPKFLVLCKKKTYPPEVVAECPSLETATSATNAFIANCTHGPDEIKTRSPECFLDKPCWVGDNMWTVVRVYIAK